MSLISRFLDAIRRSIGLLLVMAATCGTAYAAVPEIDPASASGALAMLVSGYFMIAGSRRRK